MTIRLKHTDRLGNIHFLTRTDKGGISLSGQTGISLSLSYAFGKGFLPVQMELEEQVTPETFLAVAMKHSPLEKWSVEPSQHDPAKTRIPKISTVGYTDGCGNRMYVRKPEKGRAYLVGHSGIPLAMSNIVMGSDPAVEERLSRCTTSQEIYETLRPIVYNAASLVPFPERESPLPEVSPEMEEALTIVAGLLDDHEGAADAAVELLARYGFDASNPRPKPSAARKPR